MTDMFCADCIHLAQWPERVEQYGYEAVHDPFFPLHACMACGSGVVAVSPSYSPDDRGCIAYGCPNFERGNRKNHYKEV